MSESIKEKYSKLFSKLNTLSKTIWPSTNVRAAFFLGKTVFWVLSLGLNSLFLRAQIEDSDEAHQFLLQHGTKFQHEILVNTSVKTQNNPVFGFQFQEKMPASSLEES